MLGAYITRLRYRNFYQTERNNNKSLESLHLCFSAIACYKYSCKKKKKVLFAPFLPQFVATNLLLLFGKN